MCEWIWAGAIGNVHTVHAACDAFKEVYCQIPKLDKLGESHAVPQGLDYDLWVRMAAAGANIIHIPDFLACSRTHEQQKTTVGMPYLPEVQRLLREYASHLVRPPSQA